MTVRDARAMPVHRAPVSCPAEAARGVDPGMCCAREGRATLPAGGAGVATNEFIMPPSGRGCP